MLLSLNKPRFSIVINKTWSDKLRQSKSHKFSSHGPILTQPIQELILIHTVQSGRLLQDLSNEIMHTSTSRASIQCSICSLVERRLGKRFVPE
jgi:hypothetical protein